MGAFMDEHLARLGRERDITLTVPQFRMVPEILQTTDWVCSLPKVLLSGFEPQLDLFPLPFEAENFALAMAWHPRNQDDPAVAWLRELILSLPSGQC